MALTKTQVSELYVAIFNRASEGEGNQFWQGAESVAAAAADMLASAPAQEYFGSALDSNQAFIEHIYLNTFNKTVADDAAGIQFWVDALEAGASRGEIVAGIVQAATDPANAGAAQDQFLNRVAVSNYTADNLDSVDLATQEDAVRFDRDLTVTADDSTVDSAKAAIDEVADGGNGGGATGEPGETIMLTEGRDVAEGTADNDTFMGLVGQNQDGALSNAFATGDYIDGGNGRDKIEASVMEDQETEGGADSAINARTVNVEEVYLEALDLNGAGGIAGQDTVVVDAGRMDSVEQFWSDNSSADLIIDDVRLGSKLSVTKDITFGMRDVDVDAGLEAWFDTNSLTNEGSFAVNSSLVIRAADVSTETPEAPLTNVELEIGFTIGGEDVAIVVRSEDGSYAGLRNAIEAALAEAGQSDLNVALSNPYNEVVFAGNTTNLPFTAQEIVITDPNGNEFENVDFQAGNINPVPGGFLLAGNAEPQDPSTSTTLIESNLVLDNAGRGSTAGDVTIGGMSGSGKVVEKLNLAVDRDSKIGNLLTGFDRTAGPAFKQIEVTSLEAQGDLVIGNIGNAEIFNATAFTGENLSVTGLAGVNTVAPGADVDANADDEAYAYNTGSSNDTVNVTWAHDKAAEFADYSLSVNTGSGNDSVILTSVDTGTGNLPDQQELNNVIVNTGAGDDVIVTAGDGAVFISAGAGNDTVYTDNTGVQTTANVGDQKAHWVFNNDTAADGDEITDLQGFAPIDQVLGFIHKGQLTVTFSGATTAGGGVTGAAAVAATNGFESTVSIDAGSDSVLTRAEYNDAIMRAINEDEVLSKLLVATDGPNNSLVIESLIDGVFAADDLAFDVTSTDISTLNATEQAQVLSKFQAFAGDSNANAAAAQTANAGTVTAANGVTLSQAADATVDIVGAASGFNNDGTVVDAGPGNDVVVLSTNADSNEVVAFNGVFGEVTIVNFDDDATTPSTGVDQLDFTSYLTTQTTTSGSQTSASPIAVTSAETTAAAGVALAANGVTEITGFNSAAVNGETWEALSASDLLAAFQDSNAATYGNLADFDPQAAIATLLGDTRSHIVAIENDANAGEYKFFTLTSSDNGTDVEFTSATEIGIIDFGANVDFGAANDILVG